MRWNFRRGALIGLLALLTGCGVPSEPLATRTANTAPGAAETTVATASAPPRLSPAASAPAGEVGLTPTVPGEAPSADEDSTAWFQKPCEAPPPGLEIPIGELPSIASPGPVAPLAASPGLLRYDVERTFSLSGTMTYRTEQYIVNPDGSDRRLFEEHRPLPPGVEERMDKDSIVPIWSPDGHKVVFLQQRQLYVVNADGSGLIQLTPEPIWMPKVVWSPDSRLIMYNWKPPEVNTELFVARADGSKVTRLTDNRVPDDFEAWSPDSSKIAFISNCSHEGELLSPLHVVNADGSGLRNLSYHLGYDQRPSWSPDSRTLLFSFWAPKAGVSNAYYMASADGAGLALLPSKPGLPLADTPVWSPDGRKLAVEVELNSGNRIYLMNPDGTGLTRLTREEDINRTETKSQHERYPRWSLDGRLIAFTYDLRAQWKAQEPGEMPRMAQHAYVVGIDGTSPKQVSADRQGAYNLRWVAP